MRKPALYICLVFVIVLVLTVAFYLHFRQTPKLSLTRTIAEGDVNALAEILQCKGLDQKQDQYIIKSILWRPASFRRDYTASAEQIARRDKVVHQMVRLLVEHGADVNEADDLGNSPLIYAITLNMENVVNYLLENGAITTTRDNHSATPLMLAAAGGNVNVVTKLLLNNASATINNVDNKGNSALHYANDPKIVELLLSNGADPTARNHNGDTALSLAQKYNQQDIVSLLQQYTSR